MGVGCESSAPTKDEQTAEQETQQEAEEETQQAKDETQKEEQQAEPQDQVADNNENTVPENDSSDEIVLSEEEKAELGIENANELDQPVNNEEVVGEDQLVNEDVQDGVVDNPAPVNENLSPEE